MGYGSTSLDELAGDGLFRKIRQRLGVTAFGVNALTLPVGAEWFAHYHDRQDELYFVHRGRAGVEIEGDVFELGEGGLCHVESTTPRKFWNAGDEELVLLIVGGADGYVQRDGQLVNPDEADARRAVGAGDLSQLPQRHPAPGQTA